MILTEEQIEFIRQDVVSRGITLENLQDDLVDHLCCLLEQHPADAGDFQKVYAGILQSFYTKELKEIETATILCLNHKTIAMKKFMTLTGIFAASVLSLGIVLKFMHAPGSAVAIVSGTFLFSLLFLPLLAIVRMREKQSGREKALISLGAFSASLMSLSFVFRIQHWPGAMVMLYLAIGLALLLFLPIFFSAGIRKPETKMQTLVVSILLVTGCGLWLSLVASPSSVRRNDARNMQDYLLSEQILKTEQLQSANRATASQEKRLFEQCESLKASLFAFASRTGTPEGDVLREEWLDSFFAGHPERGQLVNDLNAAVIAYNKNLPTGNIHSLPEQIFREITNVKTVDALHGIIQVQMVLLQNERAAI